MRDSGWYRVIIDEGRDHELVMWSSRDGVFVSGFWSYKEHDMHYIDPQIVMTPSGQIVYSQPSHDPLYNTKQDGRI